MKRPPQLWVISIGILCLSLLPSTTAVRATSLIFAKTTTTTTTTEASAEGETKEEGVTVANEGNTEANQTVTKPPLTGIPQIDYIWDPNLPFELRGYNLSDYPFYDRVPEEIDFKCDGLHDGFYASVPHKCQVYHHCLFGTRFDFLCANFTAFDQKTFICHFVSEVDCNNSKKFWHRNDALYQAASTTTPSTTTAAVPITVSPALNPALRRPPPALSPAGGRRRRPFRRRRPQYDYYYDDLDDYDIERVRDEYYDDVPPRTVGRRRKRPRPNRRPEYDEYDEYEDDKYERRPSGRRDEDRERRPYDRRDDDRRFDDRRPANKNKDRRVEDEDDRRSSDERRRPLADERKPLDERRRPTDDRLADDEYDRRSYDRPRKPSRDRYDDERDEDRRSDRPRKSEDDKIERRPYDRRKPDDNRRYRPKDPKLDDEERRPRPKETKVDIDDKEDRTYNRPRKPADDDRRWRPKETKIEDRVRPTEEVKLIKPNSGSSVYDRPRAPPIIRRPVPKTERDKFDYKPTPASKNAPQKDDEDYYDYYEDDIKSSTSKPTRKPITESRDPDDRRGLSRPRRPQIIARKPVDDIEEDSRRSIIKRPTERPSRDQNRSKEQIRSRDEDRPRFESNKKRPPVEEEYLDEYEEDTSKSTSKEREPPKSSSKENRDPPIKERDHRHEPVVKIVKRPFLPSRGGNPFVARGLQPVGSKALDITDTVENLKKDETFQSEEQIENSSKKIIDNLKPIKFFPRPTSQENSQNNKKTSNQEDLTNKNQDEIPQSEEKTKHNSDEYYDDEEFKPVTSRPKGEFRNSNIPRPTQKSKVPDNYRNPLDINENEYDVTLNDALNPTLPNLPVRSIPTGFSNGRDGYIAQNYQRPRLISVESPALSPASSDYVYQVKQPQNAQVQSVRYNPYVTVQQLNYRHSPGSGGQYYTTYQ